MRHIQSIINSINFARWLQPGPHHQHPHSIRARSLRKTRKRLATISRSINRRKKR